MIILLGTNDCGPTYRRDVGEIAFACATLLWTVQKSSAGPLGGVPQMPGIATALRQVLAVHGAFFAAVKRPAADWRPRTRRSPRRGARFWMQRGFSLQVRSTACTPDANGQRQLGEAIAKVGGGAGNMKTGRERSAAVARRRADARARKEAAGRERSRCTAAAGGPSRFRLTSRSVNQGFRLLDQKEPTMLRIHGVPFSAHTRKVILAAIEKGIAYELVPVVLLAPPAGWTDLSPLGLIPAIEHDGQALADSSVICLTRPGPPSTRDLPVRPEALRARLVARRVRGRRVRNCTCCAACRCRGCSPPGS